MQVAGLTFAPLGLPDWGVRVLIIMTIAGFPAVFFLAWLIDFKSDGFMFDLPLWPTPEEINVPPSRGSKIVAIMMSIGVLVGTIGLTMYLHQVLPQPDTEDLPQKITAKAKKALPDNSIAVLAFESFASDSSTDYFAAGLAEEILNFLARVQELNVAARTSSFRFQDQQVDIRDVAQVLNVRHVLEGSVRREGDRVRVTAKLIDGEEGFQTWTSFYERDLDGIFALQQEIAAAVVNELKIALSLDSRNQLEEVPDEDIDAYIYYLQGREKLRSSKDADVLITAIKLFDQAIAIDPNYARAFAGLCEANLGLYEKSNSVEDFDTAQQACDQAKLLNTSLTSEINVALSRLYRYRGWYDRALEQIDVAITLAPTAPDAYIERGETLIQAGQMEAAKSALLRAVDLKRNYWKAHEALANYYYMTEQYEASARTYEIVTRLAPDSAVGFAGKGAAYWMAGQTEQAIVAYENSLSLKPSRQALTNLGTSYYFAGQFAKAAELQNQALALAPDDHRVWGRLAESYRFLPDKQIESTNAYQNAAKLASENLAINQEDWLTRARLGLYNVYLDEIDMGLKQIERALAQSDRNSEVLYLYALAKLREGGADEAIQLLQEAVDIAGHYRQFIALDPDLQALRAHRQFSALLPESAQSSTEKSNL